MKSLILILTLLFVSNVHGSNEFHRLSAFDGMMAFDELQPLKAMVGSAEYVGVGESIHSAGGYADGRFRVTRFLIEEMGFRSVGIEAPVSTVIPINQYIQTCEGRITEAGKEIYAPWKDQAFADFAHWACLYNKKHPTDRIYFYGFDAQYQVGYSADAVKKYLTGIGISNIDPLFSGLKKCFGYEYKTVTDLRKSGIIKKLVGGDPISKSDHKSCLAGIANLSLFLKQNKNELIKKSSKKDFAWALMNMAAIRSDQDHFYYRFDMPKSFDTRDKGMALLAINIKKVERPNTRTVLWAHNAHLAMQWSKVLPTDLGKIMMGNYLAKKLGANYFPIAQIGYSVTVDDKDFGGAPKITVQPKSTDERSLEYTLHKLGSPGILVDAKSPFFRAGLYNSQWMTDAIQFAPNEQFRAYLFHDETRMHMPWKD